MFNQTIYQTIQRILTTEYNIPKDKISSVSNLSELGLDSLSSFDLYQRLEEEYCIEIGENLTNRKFDECEGHKVVSDIRRGAPTIEEIVGEIAKQIEHTTGLLKREVA